MDCFKNKFIGLQKNKSLQLKDIGEELRSSAAVIKDISEEQVKCLKEFVACKELVEWARDSVNGVLILMRIIEIVCMCVCIV